MSVRKYTNMLEVLLSVGTIFLVLVSLYFAFMIVPNERVMGPVQRIFYFHVGSAIATYVACGTLLISSILVLATRSKMADAVSLAAGEVGLVFSLVVMTTGMIWGHSAWNTWFRWEPRLVTFLLLCIVFLGLNLLRRYGDPVRLPQHCSVLGILSAVTVPAVVYSVKILPHMAQLHPVVVENRGLREESFSQAMFLAMFGLSLLCAWLMWLRARVETIERKIDLIGED